MSKHFKGVVVTFDRDIHEDDKAILTAIRMIKGVARVRPVTVKWEDGMMYARARAEIEDLLWKALHEDLPSPKGGRR